MRSRLARLKISRGHWWWIAATLVTMVAYYESIIASDLGQKMRAYIIFAFLFGEALGLIALGVLVRQLLADLRNQHRAASQVATLRGLWKALEAGAEAGGIPLETHKAIYIAGDEAFDTYDTLVRREELRPVRSKRVLARRPLRGEA